MVFGRRGSKVNLAGEDKQPTGKRTPPPPPAPQGPDVWNTETAKHVTYFVRTPWQWIMHDIAVEGMTEVVATTDLPSELQPQSKEGEASSANANTPATRRRRNATKKFKGPAMLKVELVHPATGALELAVHATSAALDGLEDKDELVRTLQRCRCDHLNISPPSVLISWDVTHEECLNVVGKSLPKLQEQQVQANRNSPGTSSDISNSKAFAVLKEPMGSQGKGIYFVEGAEEIHKVIDEHRQRALTEPDFLDNLIEVKGRIPSWGELFVCLFVCLFVQ